MAPTDHHVPSRSSAGWEALAVFLGTTAALMTLLLLLVWSQPAWFGIRPPAPQAPATGTPSMGSASTGSPSIGAGPAVTLVPRGVVEPGDGSTSPLPLGARRVTERVPVPPTLAEVLFADARPSVVHLTTLAGDGKDLPTTVEPLESDALEAVSGTGSGLVWDKDGHIVTCLHVVDGSNGATVTLANGTRWSAKLVGFDEEHDLAVVRIAAPAHMLTPVRLGRSSDLRVGMTMLSVASPYGLGHSLSVGYVSGLGRRIRSRSGRVLEDTIQTDAAIHRGSSGGALIDDQGRVVGLNAAIHADSRRATGVGFALPIDTVAEAVPHVIEDGYRWYPYVGLIVLSDQGSREVLADVSGRTGEPAAGLVIAQLDQGSTAESASLRGLRMKQLVAGGTQLLVGDLIVGVGPDAESDADTDARAPFTRGDLDRAVAGLAPGEPLVLRIRGPEGESLVSLDRQVPTR